ncbi:MAG: holo-ACP synthase [Neisseria sp.]|nr:holo-ACP synthase [Neisseria sp.]
MIYGIGTDMVETARIERLYERYGEAFAQKILSQPEWLEWTQSPPTQPVAYLAKRFAAKEAFSKAVHTGLRSPVTLSNIAVLHDQNGKPEFLCLPPLKKWLRARRIGAVHLSISDEGEKVLAFAIAEYA